MNGLTLSLPAARALHLAAQGLLRPRRQRARKDDVLDAIRTLGVLQIDTISVVARSPYLVLWSRLGDYQGQWLEEHLAEGRLFEYWAHEACFVPIEDYHLMRHRMLDPAGMGWKYPVKFLRERRDEVEQVLDHVRTRGPVRSQDFARRDGKGGGWWEWKPEKRALEALFTTGQLMIARRHNFQRVYDLRERVHPSWHDGLLPPRAEVERALALRSVRALGLARAAWVPDYYRTRRPHVDLAALARSGQLLTARVDGWDDPVYIHPDLAELAAAAADGALKPTASSLLSPFDPVVWDRRRARELFDFDYRLECYTPAPQRRYGYFVLPLLRRGVLVGRVDAKAHRQAGRFSLLRLELEAGVRPSAALAADLADAITRCARWHACPEVELGQVEPAAFAPLLAAALREEA
ncbi:winged helix-turn-helix domain-containing protein [Massilia sp. TS11]|uniref:winged helix-turn-helix domain-containing protein n=1 Tax=Massilia sp. TS11 TaxID=2908003 RepID=UPI001EDAABFF|nr:crosslink repair DNA glycosylase YcaQ family protein [Massilia sp. TS11]MCG2583356.1 winged helix DNA-binding domain-containing protein [Massilia sp. TS11]